ncbi:MAG: cation diffusion facilitator family transporter [Treponemataceae bacterium]|nr:cation diffusion facilitator family transporter [Treponemataceae bacterium]
MIKLLAKLFVKNWTDYKNPDVRKKYGILCGLYGVFLNILLFIAKFTAGTLISSIALVADAFNNLSDAASSVISVLGFKLSSKKPDQEHPFGHGRIEYIAGFVISLLIFLMGFELLKNSIEAIITPEPVKTSVAGIVIMVAAILVKLYMYIYNHSIAKKIDSVTMEATAKDSLSDTISTAVVIVSVIATKFTTLPVDGIAGVIVALFIFFTGKEAASETLEPLLGSAPSSEFVEQIEKEVISHKPICGMHDLVVHDYGPGRMMITLHAEVPGDMDIFYLHEIIDKTEFDIMKKFNCQATIHMDPVDINNKDLSELKEILVKSTSFIDPALTVHDVRMVPGKEHTNLIFDVVKPFDCKLSDEELRKKISSLIKAARKDVNCVIKVDIPFCG